MVKETEFKYHGARVEKGLFLGLQQLDILGIYLDFIDTVLTSGTVTGSEVSWVPMNINTLIVAAGYTIPVDAIGVILDVEVNDSNSDAAECKMELAPIEHNYLGPLDSYKSVVYCGDVDDRKGARTVVVWLGETFDILRKITVSGNFDYQLKLIGFLIGGTRSSLAQWPYSDLSAKFEVSHQTWAGWKAS